MVNANKELKPAAEDIFSRKYRKHIVNLKITKDSTHDNIEVTDGVIFVYNKTSALKLLRCFGHKISKLMLNYLGHNFTYNLELDSYLMEYCSETLTEISFSGSFMSVFYTCSQKPFPKVERVSFGQCNLDKNKLDKWFPNLQHLYMENLGSNTTYFSNLKSLSIERFNKRNYADSSMDNYSMEALVGMSSNLQSLKLGYFNTIFLWRIGKYLHQLEHLDLSLNLHDIHHKESSILLKSVKKLNINLTSYVNIILVRDGRKISNEINVIPQLPSTFGNLDEFMNTGSNDVKGFCHYYIDPSDEIFSTNPLKKVHLTSSELMQIKGKKVNLARAMPLVTELVLDACIFTAEEVVEFLEECKTLRKFHFLLADSNQCNILRKKLDVKSLKMIEKKDLTHGKIYVQLKR